MIWTYDSSGQLSVSSCRKLMDSVLLQGSHPIASYVWKSLVPPTVEAFVWLVSFGKLPTTDFLSNDGIIVVDYSCTFCNEVQKLVITCSYTVVEFGHVLCIAGAVLGPFQRMLLAYFSPRDPLLSARCKRNFGFWFCTQLCGLYG